MVRLLHTADWQIGKLFGQFALDDAALLAEARFTAVEHLAALANEHAVDLIVVAGDVFDAQGVAEKTIHRLFNCLSGFAGPWVMIPGNHDAALAESVWTRAQRLQAIPPNVTLCLRPEPLILETLGVAVLPAPLTQRNTHSDLTEWFVGAETPPGMLRVGVAHGSVEGILADGIDASNPIAPGRARQAALDYLALGDWHGMRQIDARTCYSGTPETDRFRANDSGRVLLVELTDAGVPPKIDAIDTGQYCWSVHAQSLEVASDIEQALESIASFGPSDVVQLSFSGLTDLAGHRRLQTAIAKASGRVRSLRADLSELHFEPTDQDIAGLNADGYLGEVIEQLRAAQQGPDARVARDALALLAATLDPDNPIDGGGLL